VVSRMKDTSARLPLSQEILVNPKQQLSFPQGLCPRPRFFFFYCSLGAPRNGRDGTFFLTPIGRAKSLLSPFFPIRFFFCFFCRLYPIFRYGFSPGFSGHVSWTARQKLCGIFPFLWPLRRSVLCPCPLSLVLLLHFRFVGRRFHKFCFSRKCPPSRSSLVYLVRSPAAVASITAPGSDIFSNTSWAEKFLT